MNKEVLNYLYKEIALRLRILKKKQGYTYKDISIVIDNNGNTSIYDDKTLINIFNGKIYGSKNPYLMSDGCIAHLTLALGCKNTHELLWGGFKSKSIKEFFKVVCITFIEDFSQEEFGTTNNVKKLLDSILVDYIPYAINSVLLNYELYPEKYGQPKIPNSKYYVPLFHYFVSKNSGYALSDQTFNKRVRVLEEAIEFLYHKCGNDFEKLFNQYTQKHSDSLQKFVKGLKNFFDTEFYYMLREYSLSESSLGLRVKNIMLSDWNLQGEARLNATQLKLLDASLKYISELENIQSETYNINQMFTEQ